MAKSWFLDGRTIARSVKTAGLASQHQIKECEEANWECQQCGCRIDDNNVSNDQWPGLPIGVKFDPSDVELLQHLAAKCGVGEKPHPYIDEFILSLDEQGGIYQHPENLPGARKDGNSIHFFHRLRNAFKNGQRKCRKIEFNNGSGHGVSISWHKTGKTKPVFDNNGVQLGFKKIMDLKYNGTSSKPCNMNWVMHQYHLGTEKIEKDGEYVVSKVFYKAHKLQTENTSTINADDESEFAWMMLMSPPNEEDPFSSHDHEQVLDLNQPDFGSPLGFTDAVVGSARDES